MENAGPGDGGRGGGGGGNCSAYNSINCTYFGAGGTGGINDGDPGVFQGNNGVDERGGDGGANTGGGGGGGAQSGHDNFLGHSGAGGSGIVIIKVPIDP